MSLNTKALDEFRSAVMRRLSLWIESGSERGLALERRLARTSGEGGPL